MYIDRLAYYEKQKIIAKVSMCLGGDNNEKHANLYVSPDFPLVDLLYQLYQTALYNSMLSPENDIITRIKHYREQIDKSFNYSFEDLIKLGWVDTCFGHHMIIGHRKSGRDEIFRNESMKCADQDILRFIFWEDERQPDSYFFIKREDAVALIAKWQQVSDKVQNLNWFCELDILCDCGEKIVISSGARYKDCITQAMGRLWNDICDEDDFVAIAPKWLHLAAQTRVYSNVLEFIYNQKDKEYRGRLLELIMSVIRTDSRFVSEEIERRKLINSFRFSSTQNLAMVSEHKDLYSFKEHRSLRKEWGHVYDDNIIWQDHQRWGDNFYLGTAIAYMEALEESNLKDVFGLLKIYADSGRLRSSYVNIQPEVFAELLLHKETFYFAAIKLVENIRPFDKESTIIVDQLSDIFQTIIEIYFRYVSKPATVDMLDLLLYIVESSKTSGMSESNDNQFLHLYNRLTKIYLNSGLAKQLIKEAPEYFTKLMKYDHGDVDFGRCFYFLCGFTDCVVSKDSREEAVISALCDEAYHGICKILTEKGRWSHFIDTECFSEALSKRIYLSHILGLTENKKRKVIGVDFETEERMDLVYRYKVATVFLTKAGYGIEYARLKLQEYLQIIMIERKKLDYSSISIFGMEKLLRDAFALLEDHKETSESFFKSLLRSELPELILCTGLLRDEEIIEAFIEEIKERVAEADDTDELLPGFNDERLIDIVLDRRIKCLYSFVQKRLDYKLERYRKRGNIERNRYYFIADSQRKSLIYIRGDIREIVKTHDQFLIAAFKTENIESSSDYTEAVQLWKNYLNSINRGDDSYSACYNYLYAIYLTIEKSSKTEFPIMVDSHTVKTFKTDFQWIIDFSVKDGMAHWGTEQQEKFFDLLIRTGVKLNTDAEYIYTYIKERTRLKIDDGKAISIVTKVVKEQAGNPEGSIGIVIKYEGNKDDEDIIAALQKYYARSLEEKTKLLAKSRAAVEDGKNWYGVFALKTVITACKILRKSVPYFVGRVKSEKQGKGEQIQVPPEDHISILFRECYNMAYQEMFGVHVDDQSKIGTTGNLLTDKKLPSPAEVDMAISYGMHTHELFEAFILKSSTETTVFRNHMGKVMGNNCDFRSPVFMLVYTFEERAKNKQKWSKYREYLEKGFEQDYKDVENGTGIKSRLADIEDSDCYIHSFNYGLNELDFIRQVVTIDENDVEIIHILIDMSLSIQRDIRKSS